MKPDDQTGYKRPPLHMRFQKGVSGNPKGRPKKAPANERDLLRRILDQEVKVQVRGKTRVITRRESQVLSLGFLAAKGDLSAAAMLIQIVEHAAKGKGVDPVMVVMCERDLML